MKKLLLLLIPLTCLASPPSVGERDRDGKLVSTTTNGVKRDSNGRIVETRSQAGGTETRRDPNGAITSTRKTK